jgi:peptidoglycan/LPS O-acetylase OafA/YrhL
MLPAGLSLYLDLLRWLASWLVVLCHLGLMPILEPNLANLSFFATWGHEAVVLFFVLSGFIIQHAAVTSDRTLQDFLASRLSRIYSVVIPCIALTILFDQLGQRFEPAMYAKMGIEDAQSGPFSRIVVSLTFFNQSWKYVRMFSNLPYWSICYEFWYYVLFAIYYYRSGRTRLVLLGCAVLLAGPWILLLMPIWLLGCAVYKEKISNAWSKPAVLLAFAQPLVVLPIYSHFDLLNLSQQWSAIISSELGGYTLGSSTTFVADYVLAVSVALHLMAAKRLHQQAYFVLAPVASTIRAFAGRSFTLYLLHMPLMYVSFALTQSYAGSPIRAVWLVIFTIGTPLLVASLCENQRHQLKPLMRRLVEHYWPTERIAVTPSLPSTPVR